MAELQALGQALIQLEQQGVNPKGVNIIRLWVLTGCRRTEIESLQWDCVDFKSSRLDFKDTKTGKSTRPLGPPAL